MILKTLLHRPKIKSNMRNEKSFKIEDLDRMLGNKNEIDKMIEGLYVNSIPSF